MGARTLFLVLLAAPAYAQTVELQRTVSGSVQTGIAETFQLTLGGTFGAGPAWQNRVTLGVNNVFVKGDAVQVYGFTTTDTRTPKPDWHTGISYKRRLLRVNKTSDVTGTIGYQHWEFGSVFCGTNDHLIAANLTFQSRVRKIPVTVSADSWRLLSSPYRLGTILYPQAWTTHVLWRHETTRLVLKPTVSTTYSWHFWDRSGHRVFRYGACLALEGQHYTLESSVRRQVALLNGIPENTFYSFSVARLF